MKSISDLCLRTATENTLRYHGIMTVDTLCRNTAVDLLRLEGIGKKALAEITECLATAGRSLGEEVTDGLEASIAIDLVLTPEISLEVRAIASMCNLPTDAIINCMLALEVRRWSKT